MVKIDLRESGAQLASLAVVALRSFVRTCLALVALGAVLAGASFTVLRDLPWYVGLAAAALALAEAVAAGVFLGTKRGVARAAQDALGAMRMGEAIVRLVFDRMLGVADGSDAGGLVARSLQKLPLAQAQELLGRAVRTLLGDADRGSWLRRTIQKWLLDKVQNATLSRFREQGAAHGGIDLRAVQSELERTVDASLSRKVRVGTRLTTVFVAIGLPLLVALQTWAIRQLFRSGE